MLRFTPGVRRILWATAAAFVLLVGLRLHGFSLPMWHELIEGTPSDDVLLGQPREIRGDDWRLQLPLAFAQREHDPPFPVVNRNIGTGQNMLVPLPLPVAHPATLFRPTYWGFFVGGDIGLAWMWWSQLLGLFVAWLLVFLVVTGNRLGLSAAGSLLLVASPFFQFWSYRSGPVAGYMGLCFVAAVGLAETRSPRAALGWGALLGWAGGAFALTIYPPYSVSLAYLFLFLAAGHLWQRWPALALRSHGRARLLGLALALAISGAALLSLVLDSADAIRLLADTVYPGARLETGGDAPGWQLVSAHLATGLRVENWLPLVNECESSSFLLLFPVTLGAVGLELATRRRRPDRLLLALAALLAVVMLFRHVGFPEALARATLWSAVPAKRTTLVLGLLDALVLLRFLAGEAAPVGRGPALALACGGAALLALGAVDLHGRLPELGAPASFALVGLGGVVAYRVLRRARPAALVGAVAAGLAASALWFNPLVAGGSDYLKENPLARKILAIDAERGGQSLWLTYGLTGPEVQNLFRAIGVHALDGTHVIPHFPMWRVLDPGGARRRVYNRYSIPLFSLPDPRWRRISLVPPWFVIVPLHPRDPKLRELGVTHLLVRTQGATQRSRDLRFWRRLAAKDRVGGFVVYELPLRRARAPGPAPGGPT